MKVLVTTVNVKTKLSAKKYMKAIKFYKEKLLPVPLTELGNSHGYRTYGTIEECDITGDNAMKSYKETNHDHNSIGITWPAEMFAYCLHASIARTRTEDQKDGIKELENDAYTFLKTNVGEYWHLLSKDLETMYNFKISERNKRRVAGAI